MATKSNTTNPEMSLEQLIAIFGPETAATMHAQMTAGNGGGGAPFPFLKKVSTHGSELGDFGEFVYGIKTEKDAAGNKTITDKGTNVGKDFEFIIVNVSYRYTSWDEAKQKGLRSNVFTTLDGIKTAVDSYTGKPLPASKEDKDAAKWKLNRINAGLIRANSKAAWEPVIWETTGALYWSLGKVIESDSNKGLLSGICKLVTKLDSKGSTQYPTIDVEKSSFSKESIFTSDEINASLGDITNKMTEYAKANAGSAQAPAAQAPACEDETNW